LRGIYSYGFEQPSVIQQKAIIPTMSGRDILAMAQSGTGKTATFAIGSLAQIDISINKVQALMLAPTRELAIQIQDVVNALGDFMGARAYACVGGTAVRGDAAILQHSQSVHVIAGTPGRVLDLIQRGIFETSFLKTLIIDEADEMLSLGFKDQIYEIFQLLPSTIQAGLFSATMPPEVQEITKKFMNNPVKILLEQEAITLAGIRQFFISCEQERFKFEVLCDLYDTLNIAQTVIFVNTKKKVDWLANELRAKDFTVSCIHGDLSQDNRSDVLARFKDGGARILIATDIIGRGIDVHGISLVINYDLPKNYEKYIHRIGRSGRFGRKGVAINLVASNDFETMSGLDKYYSTSVTEMPANIADLL